MTRSLPPLALLLGLSFTGSASAQSTPTGPTPLGPSVTQPAPAPRPGTSGPTPLPAGSPTPPVRTGAATTSRVVHVLGLDSENADEQVEALTTVLRDRIRSTSTWSLGTVTRSLSTVTVALKCSPRPDAECTQRIGDEFKADRFMYGWINKSAKGEVTAEVHLWTRGQREIVATETYPDSLVDPKDLKLLAVADRILGKLLGEKTATPAPVKPPEEAPKAKLPEEPKPVESQGVSARTVIAWSAIGLGVGAGVFGAVQGVRFLSLQSDNKDDANRSAEKDFCSSPNRTAECDRYEDAKTARTLEFISFGVGAALVGTGVVLLLTDPGKERPARAATSTKKTWQVVPRVGARGGTVDLHLTF